MRGIHQHLHTAPYLCGEQLIADVGLNFHKRIPAPLLDFIRHLIGQCCRHGAVFCLIGKHTHVLKTAFFYKTAQTFKMLFRFARIANNKGRAQSRMGQHGAHGIQYSPGVARKRPTHARQHIRVSVLQGNIQIRQQRRAAISDKAQKLRRHACGVQVEQAQPGEALKPHQFFKQAGQAVLEPKINTPGGQILRHKIKLAHALGQQGPGFIGNIVGGKRFKAAPDGRNGAERALVPAPLAHLEPCVRRAGRKQSAAAGDTGRRLGQVQGRCQHGWPARQITRGQPHVHFRQFRCQIGSAITPHHAAAYSQQGLNLALFKPLDGVHNRANRFTHGRVDESAGIDENQTRLAHVFHMLHGDPKRTEQALTVHAVFGAAKAQRPYFQGIRKNSSCHGGTIQRGGALVIIEASPHSSNRTCPDRQICKTITQMLDLICCLTG